MRRINFPLHKQWIFVNILIFFTSFSSLNGQVYDGEKIFVTSYHEIISYLPEIHVGTQYVQDNRHVDGHPFYNNQILGLGKITISGFSYVEVPLQYDIVKDLVITVTPVKTQKSIIDPDKIERFTLGDSSTFVKFKQQNVPFYHGNGFYREIAKGNIGLYCKHNKEIIKDSSPMTPFNSFFENQRFYIHKNNEFYAIRRRKDIFSLLQITKGDIRSEIRKDGLKFRKNKEAYIKVAVNKALETDE
jgi:hypothetical protein